MSIKTTAKKKTTTITITIIMSTTEILTTMLLTTTTEMMFILFALYNVQVPIVSRIRKIMKYNLMYLFCCFTVATVAPNSGKFSAIMSTLCRTFDHSFVGLLIHWLFLSLFARLFVQNPYLKVALSTLVFRDVI